MVLLVITLLCHVTAFVVPLSSSYYPVLCWRGLSGALVISSLPIYLSILGDSFPPSIRSTASVISSSVVGFGMLAGQTLSGFMSVRYGWRFFFKLIPLLGLFTLALLSRVLLSEASPVEVSFPHRGESDGMTQSSPKYLDISAREVLSSLRVRSNVLRTPTHLI